MGAHTTTHFILSRGNDAGGSKTPIPRQQDEWGILLVILVTHSVARVVLCQASVATIGAHDNIETLPILCSSNREAPPQRTITDMQWGFLTTLSQF